MYGTNKIIKALKGEESLLLIFPKDVNSELNIENCDLLEYMIKDKEIIIKKINLGEI